MTTPKSIHVGTTPTENIVGFIISNLLLCSLNIFPRLRFCFYNIGIVVLYLDGFLLLQTLRRC